MGLFTRRTKRVTRRAEARALKAKAKLEARLAARNETRRIKALARGELAAARIARKARRASDRAALKIAQTERKTAAEGHLLTPAKVRRVLTVSRLLAPVVVPVAYRGAMAVRGALDRRRAAQLGVPLSQLGRFSGTGGALSARIAGAEQSLVRVAEKKPRDAETREFVTAVEERLADLAAAVAAAENMPAARRRASHAAIGTQLDGVDADLMARLGVS